MIKQITDQVYYMPHRETTARPALAIICGNKYTMIIDSGNSPKHAEDLLSEVRQMDIPPLKYLLITHHHWDHIFGIKKMGLISIASKETEKKINAMRQLKWNDQALNKHIERGRFNEYIVKCIKEEIPNRDSFEIGTIDLVYHKEITIDLGNLKCIVKLIGGSHALDSSIVYIPKEKVLFLGDCLYGQKYNGVYGYKGESLLPMIDMIEEYSAEHYIMSHMANHNKTQVQELCDRLRLAERIVGNDTCAKKSIKRFSDNTSTSPSEDLKFYIKCFADVNKVLLKDK